MSKKDAEEWEAVLQSLTTDSKKRKEKNNTIVAFLSSIIGAFAGLGIISFISGFLLMRLNHHANEAWDFVPVGAGYWDCFAVMMFVWLLYMMKVGIQTSMKNASSKGDA